MKVHDNLMGKVEKQNAELDKVGFISEFDMGDNKIFCCRCNAPVKDISIKRNICCMRCAGQ